MMNLGAGSEGAGMVERMEAKGSLQLVREIDDAGNKRAGHFLEKRFFDDQCHLDCFSFLLTLSHQ